MTRFVFTSTTKNAKIGRNRTSYVCRKSQAQIDFGERLEVGDAVSRPLFTYNGRRQNRRHEYDELGRPTHVWLLLDGRPEQLVERTVYGEGHPQALARNLRGQAYQLYDDAGVFTTSQLDFKGNVTEAQRRVTSDFRASPDWSALAAPLSVELIETTAEPLLMPEAFRTRSDFDAINRLVRRVTVDGSSHRYQYNAAGLLERVLFGFRGAEEVPIVDGVEYNARGQRLAQIVDDPNAGTPSIRTEYSYDALTFQVKRVLVRRLRDGVLLQDLRYVHDPIGSILEVQDRSDTQPIRSGANPWRWALPLRRAVSFARSERPRAPRPARLVLSHVTGVATWLEQVGFAKQNASPASLLEACTLARSLAAVYLTAADYSVSHERPDLDLDGLLVVVDDAIVTAVTRFAKGSWLG